MYCTIKPTPTLSPVSDEYRRSDQSLTYYVEFHIDIAKYFDLHKELA
jgi:hypothetical protein